MDLWIRSKDRKRLIKCEKLITVEFADKTECEIWDNTVKLGSYKNIERALEVLDEIERLITDLQYMSYAIENDKFTGYRPNVYQMPID